MDKQNIYAQTIKEAYPSPDIHSTRLHTADGQFNDVLFLNADLIFRFPRYEESVDDFLREIELLQKLQGHLSLPIPDPLYVSSGTRSVVKVFMGYYLLVGRPLFREALNAITNESTLESLAQPLANFLQDLYDHSPGALDLELPVKDGLAESKKLYSNIQEHLFPFMRPEARNAITEYFMNFFDEVGIHEYEPCMIHGDFGGSNILFDQGKITGIIDFSFPGLDDPARDIAALSTYGDTFFARTCRYYPNIESLLERARIYRGTFALSEALHAFRNNDRELL